MRTKKHGSIGLFWKFLPEILIISLVLITAGMNFWYFRTGSNFIDNSLAAKFLSDHPNLNPKLYAKNNEIRIIANNSDPNFNPVYAQSLELSKIFSSDQLKLNLQNKDSNLTNVAIADYDSRENKPFEYEVKTGDTLSQIATKFGLKLETVLWANHLSAKTIINPGQKLILLPTDGVLHKVKKGDTISKIASLYQTNSQKIIDYNRVEDVTKIHSGDLIIVPGGTALAKSKKSLFRPSTYSNTTQKSTRLIWPTTIRTLTQKYSSAHRGLDISNSKRLPIYASHAGRVEFSGLNGAWGYTIVIRGDDGLVTRYSHNSKNYVKTGEIVEAGEIIGKIGNSGRVRGKTGIHLDFRVYKNGITFNPLNFLN